MTDIQIFNHEDFGGVRVVEIDGQPFFVGADVANALGYANPRDALAKHVDSEDKRASQIATPSGIQTMTVINESGVYSLILRSNLPKAKEFKRWVTSVVLPSIRKHGVYMTPDAAEKILLNPDFIIQLAQQVKDAQAKIAELQPKASYYDLILNCKDLVSVTKIAKDYGMSGVKFNRLLDELDVQFRQSGVWILKQKFAKLGWAQTKTHNYLADNGETHCKVLTYWTQKGRVGLYDLLKARGYLPLIEQEEHNG